MSNKFRCPVDDVVFDAKKVNREPTLNGHPECPGPECQQKLADGYYDETLAELEVSVPKPKPASAAPVTTSAAAPGAPTRATSIPSPGQGW